MANAAATFEVLKDSDELHTGDELVLVYDQTSPFPWAVPDDEEEAGVAALDLVAKLAANAATDPELYRFEILGDVEYELLQGGFYFGLPNPWADPFGVRYYVRARVLPPPAKAPTVQLQASALQFLVVGGLVVAGLLLAAKPVLSEFRRTLVGQTALEAGPGGPVGKGILTGGFFDGLLPLALLGVGVFLVVKLRKGK